MKKRWNFTLNHAIGGCSDILEKQLVHQFDNRTKELKTCIEDQFKILIKVLTRMKEDIVTIVDVIDKNIKSYVKKMDGILEKN